jgi:hypothetical protein
MRVDVLMMLPAVLLAMIAPAIGENSTFRGKFPEQDKGVDAMIDQLITAEPILKSSAELPPSYGQKLPEEEHDMKANIEQWRKTTEDHHGRFFWVHAEKPRWSQDAGQSNTRPPLLLTQQLGPLQSKDVVLEVQYSRQNGTHVMHICADTILLQCDAAQHLSHANKPVQRHQETPLFSHSPLYSPIDRCFDDDVLSAPKESHKIQDKKRRCACVQEGLLLLHLLLRGR